MTINAFKNNVSIFNESVMNPILALQDFTITYEGTQFDGATAAGTTENSLADYYYVSELKNSAGTTFSRIDLELKKDGEGQDFTLYILDGDFSSGGTAEGTVLKTVVVPKEFIVTSVGTYLSIPINLSGLTANATYWFKTGKVGDATNFLSIVGLSSDDTTCFHRSGTTGAWTANNTLHFKAFSGNTGDIIHCIEGTNLVETYIYSGEYIESIYRYLPPSDGSAGGIRDIITLTFDGDYLTSGEVT